MSRHVMSCHVMSSSQPICKPDVDVAVAPCMPALAVPTPFRQSCASLQMLHAYLAVQVSLVLTCNAWLYPGGAAASVAQAI